MYILFVSKLLLFSVNQSEDNVPKSNSPLSFINFKISNIILLLFLLTLSIIFNKDMPISSITFCPVNKSFLLEYPYHKYTNSTVSFNKFFISFK